MFSIFPAFVAALFLACGIYAISVNGANRVSLSFFLLCLTTAAWQGTWAVLFQVENIDSVRLLIKIGYTLIVFLPSTFYLFSVEICFKATERRMVILSFAVAVVLTIAVFEDRLFVRGEYHYFFGYYPMAGKLHPIHVIQSILIALRCPYIVYRKMTQTKGREQEKILLCLKGLFIFCFAALDYLCNYGIEIYPPGVVFLLASVACFTWAIFRYDLLHPYSLAASVAHEMRGPLSTIRLYSEELGRHLPDLCATYKAAVDNGVSPASINPEEFERLSSIPAKIGRLIRQSNVNIDTFLAVTRELDSEKFAYTSIDKCVTQALDEYPFTAKERQLITFKSASNFNFIGSGDLLTFVLFNLIKNALWAIKSSKKGNICITTYESPRHYILAFRDTALGIPPDDLPYIFDEFFSTRQDTGGTGVGLSFCRHVIKSFGGNIRCNSEYGVYTEFLLEFPRPDIRHPVTPSN